MERTLSSVDRARVFIYRIDAEDQITQVSDAWLRFAEENAATSLDRAGVVGRSLWDFIDDVETRHLYELIFERVRQTRVPRTIPFRCDSLDRRRYMELEISPASGERLQLTSRLLREEARPHGRVLDAGAARGSDLLPLCSWCKRVKITLGTDGWREVEEALGLLGVFDEPRPPQITHVTCPDCAQRARYVLKGSVR